MAAYQDYMLSKSGESLHAAWGAVEAVMPRGHVLAELRRSTTDGSWHASTDNLTDEGRYHYAGSGPTPIEALRDLADTLRRVRDGATQSD